jgi:hypothetical protein
MAAMLGCCAFEALSCVGCAACSCCGSIVSASLGHAQRFGHIVIIVLTFTFAIIVGQYYPDKLNGYYSGVAEIDLTSGCNDLYQDSCMYRQLIYRASFSLFLLFLMLSMTSYMTAFVDKGMWMPKFAFAFVLFIGLWWGDNAFFTGYSEFARVFSFFWLLVQALLLLDFAHDAHDVIMQHADAAESNGADNSGQKIMYLAVSVGCLVAAVVGLVYLFKDYAGCEAGQAFTVITLLMGVLTTIISMLNVVNKGLLTPCIMFAYSVFICWYALLSSNDTECNPYANDNQGPQTAATVIIAVVTLVILLYCVVNGTVILNIFDSNGEGVVKSYAPTTRSSPSKQAQTDKSKELNAILTGTDTKGSSGSKPADVEGGGSSGSSSPETGSQEAEVPGVERAFFHVLMTLVSLYGAMVLTAWGKADGVPNGVTTSRTSSESMWLKIVSQWVFLLLYCKVLHVAYTDRENI